MTTTIDLDDLLTTKEAATLLGLKYGTLEIWRSKGQGPEFLKLGDSNGAAVRYQRSVLTAWLAQRAYKSTSQHTVAHARPAPTFAVGPSVVPRPWESTTRASSQPRDASE
jgi:predicted DNA-binding transcriptional regulator AlpA